jgi:prepilin-type N-terminal cleavage/methylation domain-containing protein/prepilin-type processing-associated H-X9-DG protein
MRRPATRAFTLVELMVVMAIIAILLALLAPGVRQVWSTVASTQCQRNLNAIFQAQAAWRADSGGQNYSGRAWVGRLMPYVDRNEGVFRCPSAEAVVVTVPRAAARPKAGQAAADCRPQPPGSERLESAFEFCIYRRLPDAGAAAAKIGPGPGLRGELAYTIPVDSHPWVQRTQQGNAILYEMDDEGPAGGADKPITCDDIRFVITFDGGRPATLQVLQQTCMSSPYKKYVYDLLVNGDVLVSDWTAHIGETYDLSRADAPGGGEPGAGAPPSAPRRASAGPPVRYVIVPSDYGLSKGTYSLPNSILGSMDPRLAMALDYPKPVAEYSGEGGDEWKWDKYFVEDPRRWKQEWGAAGEDCGQYQSLRHFGRANVLFCDGHIESLAPECLRPGRALWSGQGW